MAFSIYASTGSTTTQLNDGNPFWLESAEGLSGAPVVRHSQRGPLQDGDTDLGHRLQPRMVTLNILFYAATDTLLDTYRTTLASAFNPLPELTTFLSVARDDDEVRVLRCHVADEIVIDLVPEEKAGRLHRATVRLRAANPLYRANSVTSGTTDYATLLGSWHLASGEINSSQVKGTAILPSVASGWNIGGAITGDWGIAVVTQEYGGAADGFDKNIWTDSGSASFRRLAGGTTYAANAATNGGAGYVWLGGTAANFHAVVSISGNTSWYYWTGSDVAVAGGTAVDTNLAATGGWRTGGASNQWPWDIQKAIIWSDATQAEVTALARTMLGKPASTFTLVNDGDVNAYPLMTLSGPIVDPVIVNTTTGGSINLSGVTLTATDTLTIDLRDGNKQIYNQAGSNYLGSVTSPIGLADFYLAPAPIASGGTNTITLTPGSAGTATFFRVEITNQYMSF